MVLRLQMITDTIENELLLFVSAVPYETRAALANFISLSDGGPGEEPSDYLMEIERNSFGHGYMLGIDESRVKCLFGKQEKTLLYPRSIDGGMVRKIKDFRGNND